MTLGLIGLAVLGVLTLAYGWALRRAKASVIPTEDKPL